MARASAFQAEGRGFESRFPLQQGECSGGRVDTLAIGSFGNVAKRRAT